MTTLGILTCRTGMPPKHITKLAKDSLQIPMEIVCFRPSDIQPITHEINGYTFDKQNEKWLSTTFPLPSLLYDRCFYTAKENRMQNASVVKWLQTQKNITFLNHSLPNKIEVYELLQSIPFFAPFLSELKRIEKTTDCIHALNQNGEVLLQAETSQSTHGQILCKQDGMQYKLQTIRNKKIIEKTIPSIQLLEEFFNQLFKHKPHILSPVQHFYTKNRDSFILRFLLQKDKNGVWCVKGKVVILNPTPHWNSSTPKEKFVHFQTFIYQNFPRNFRMQLHTIQSITQQFPIILDKHFQSQFEYIIDIGIDYRLQPILINWNHKPTSKIFEQMTPYCEFPIENSSILYGLYLAQHIKNKKE